MLLKMTTAMILVVMMLLGMMMVETVMLSIPTALTMASMMVGW